MELRNTKYHRKQSIIININIDQIYVRKIQRRQGEGEYMNLSRIIQTTEIQTGSDNYQQTPKLKLRSINGNNEDLEEDRKIDSLLINQICTRV